MIRRHKSQLNPLSHQHQDRWPSIIKKLFEAQNHKKNDTSTPAIIPFKLKKKMYKYAFILWVHPLSLGSSTWFPNLLLYLLKAEQELNSCSWEPRILPHLYNLSPDFTVALPALNLTAVYKQFAFIKSFPSIRLNFHGNDDSITFLLIFHQYCNIYLIL